ncbi:MAG: Fimbrial assembly family protein [Candidatus Gottesmanbacteria bacterium GW2011_GWB1_43_11]|uniref:Fimbrial assembly family protein n=1 Tax=Candidatus Gottesmanbacteria bacterium GW2011_GWB1_43_11 TaxID=1618446 RepID=A0A0G1CMD7_9BACT|nr:MAG: Fimbrial assembly family protein [Candidatus Gottesmanbacteria bacterium GW2011_GWA2_42_16]KKS55676.1 MAG: Fimbrial assembly family protein [Candidatus Gottesmanbacteria bacterium GW2011_GWA1_42_26]KKS81473.1 MAG: Fimbrial assembly family protein [Candidatus Gottesmanbacteria bacterium GW2011_GWC1_43_10]KKS86940.1 MAG: Fimbrial assembly family protein [Candidatus Gottesmanbacteria bacterium GW2011_GWB1_43_11]OGG09512.1 MAG: hypothetical protein A2699_03160 [Candidatus Gottesmanbacteria 
MPAININLLPQKDFEKTPLGKLLSWSLSYGRYIIICTEIIVLLAFIYRFSLDRKITDFNDEIDQKSAIIQANQEFEGKFRNLQGRVGQIGGLITDQNLMVQVIHHLEQITPEGIKLTTLNISNTSVSLSASANSNQDLALFIYQLKTSNLLAQINLTSLSKNAGGQALFTIDAAVRPRPGALAGGTP